MRLKNKVKGITSFWLTLVTLLCGGMSQESAPSTTLRTILTEAGQAVQMIEEPEIQVRQFTRVARAMARAGMLEEARAYVQRAQQAIQQVTVGSPRDALTPHLALAYAEAGLPDKAIEILKPLNLQDRLSAYEQIISALADRGLFDDALHFARLIPNDNGVGGKRDMALGGIAVAMAQRGDAARARQLTEEIQSASKRKSTLEAIADALQKAGNEKNAREARASALSESDAPPNCWEILVMAQDGDFENALTSANRIRDYAERAATLAGIAHVYVEDANNLEEGRKVLERAFEVALKATTPIKRVEALLVVLQHRNCTKHNELARRAYQEALKTAEGIRNKNERDGIYHLLIDTLIEVGFYEEAMQTAQRLTRRAEQAFKLAEIAQAEHEHDPDAARARLNRAWAIVQAILEQQDFRDLFAIASVIRIHVQMGEASRVLPAIQKLWTQIDAQLEADSFIEWKRLNYAGQQIVQLMLAAGEAETVAAWYRKQLEAQKSAGARDDWAQQGAELLIRAGYLQEALPLLQAISPPVERDETLNEILQRLVEDAAPRDSWDNSHKFRFPIPSEQREALMRQVIDQIQGRRVREEALLTLIRHFTEQNRFEEALQLVNALQGEPRGVAESETLNKMLKAGLHEQAVKHVQTRPLRTQINFWLSAADYHFRKNDREAALQALNQAKTLIQQNPAPEPDQYFRWESLALTQAHLGLAEDALQTARQIQYPQNRAQLLIRIAFLLLGDRREANLFY